MCLSILLQCYIFLFIIAYLSIVGHDMVEYFNIDAGSCGDPAIGLANYSYQLASADQNGDMRVYEFWFSSMVNQQTFASDPWKYVPKYGGFCAWGACCELPPHWPWAADHLGPPAGPDSANCGYEVYEGTLYFTIWQSYMNQFLADAEANIQAGTVDVCVRTFLSKSVQSKTKSCTEAYLSFTNTH